MENLLRKHANDWDMTTARIIGAAIEVHRSIGPGLLESAYHACMEEELKLRGLEFRREVPIQLNYRGRSLECGYRVDFVIEGVVVEIKAIEQVQPVHRAQLMTYLHLLRLPCGLLLNFHSAAMKDGITRVIRTPQ